MSPAARVGGVMRPPTAWMPTIVAASAAAALLIASAGCDRAQARKPIVLNPTTRQAPTPDATRIAATAPAPATRPSTTQAAKKSYMNINGVWVEFPAAKLIVSKD